MKKLLKWLKWVVLTIVVLVLIVLLPFGVNTMYQKVRASSLTKQEKYFEDIDRLEYVMKNEFAGYRSFNGSDSFEAMLKELRNKVKHNAFPSQTAFNLSIIKTVASYPNICSYFDIPIQHVCSSILKKMGRNYNRRSLDRLFDKIRAEVPGASLRTTLIVGFPGESEKDFNTLLRFVENTQFDHLGVFLYSDSEDLSSHRLLDHVPVEVAKERYDQLMSCQLDISARNYQQYIGQTLPVLVEEPVEKNLYVGRTPFQAPEVDGMTYIKSGPRQPAPVIGSFLQIKVSDAMEYDLIGDAI